METAYYDSPIGTLKIGSRAGNIVYVGLADKKTADDGAECSDAAREAMRQLDEYFAGKRTSFDIACTLDCTPFQAAVWEALRKIPFGETRSYAQIARAVGNPKACRAVGMANNRNPLLILVPCHRVIGSDGSLTGYAAGLDVKQKLLYFEKGKIHF
jgi:O-6-methylguanine DNA methyltransferase